MGSIYMKGETMCLEIIEVTLPRYLPCPYNVKSLQKSPELLNPSQKNMQNLGKVYYNMFINKSCTSDDHHKLLQQGYRYHKLRKTFSKFYRRHSELISKYNVGLRIYQY